MLRLRFTFKRQGRFLKTNIVVHKKDVKGNKINNTDLSILAEL